MGNVKSKKQMNPNSCMKRRAKNYVCIKPTQTYIILNRKQYQDFTMLACLVYWIGLYWTRLKKELKK